MSLRLAAPPSEIAAAARLRPSVRVATAAKQLDCHPSQIRDLIDDGLLEAHGIGKRGVRIYVESIEAYQLARQRPPKARQTVPRSQRQPPLSREHHEAMAYLRKKGLA